MEEYRSGKERPFRFVWPLGQGQPSIVALARSPPGAGWTPACVAPDVIGAHKPPRRGKAGMIWRGGKDTRVNFS